jgi:hypothetical protein
LFENNKMPYANSVDFAGRDVKRRNPPSAVTPIVFCPYGKNKKPRNESLHSGGQPTSHFREICFRAMARTILMVYLLPAQPSPLFSSHLKKKLLPAY